MSTIFSLITIFLFVAEAYAEENVYYNNGWRPISKEQILADLKRNFVKTPEHFTASWSPIVRSSENIEHFEYVKPRDINDELVYQNDYGSIEMDEKQRELVDENVQYDNWQELYDKHKYVTNIRNEKVNKTSLQRKAKEIPEDSLDNSLISNGDIKKGIKNKNVDLAKLDIDKNETLNTYEVTEASEVFEVMDLLDNIRTKNNHPLFKPNVKTVAYENLTSKLFSILGNYNIKTNDDLANYAISRKKNGSNPPKQGYVYAPSWYNSQNNFPIDPVFAVFLSNYGHYLPGLYGFPGNFHNIYGYLAANNIHNNRPFGAYKIYSDTDSSH